MNELDYLNELVGDVPVASEWRHVNTGTIYMIVGHTMIESTWRPGIVYASSGDYDITRDAEEFLDGRFVLLS